MSPVEKLVMMANQIARNLAVQGEDKTARLTSEHISRYWEPRMRAAIIEYVANGGELDPHARAAVLMLPDRRAKSSQA